MKLIERIPAQGPLYVDSLGYTAKRLVKQGLALAVYGDTTVALRLTRRGLIERAK